MSIDSHAGVTEDDGVEALASELGAAIADLPEHERFREAEAEVADDDEAQEMIAEFEQQREAFALARQAGDATQEDMRELQKLQGELHSLPVMAEYLEAKEALTDRLEALNRAISDPIAVDFGGEAGGCCQDESATNP
jgi:cell fate (sporulation/competence/biofilm development) regulator YlbF (YheA/YmcA/DUF963 family)